LINPLRSYKPNSLGAGFQVSGLPLGKHTLRLDIQVGQVLDIQAIDIITPIHVNNTKRGSLALNDDRCFGPIPKVELGVDLQKAKAWVYFNQVTNEIQSSFNISAAIDESNGITQFFFEKSFKNPPVINISNNNVSANIGDSPSSAFRNTRSRLASLSAAHTNTDASIFCVTWFGELENEGEE